MSYLRASKKQLDFIDRLCDELDEFNPTKYSRYSLERATKFINTLLRKKAKIEKQRLLDKQTKLF